MAPPAAQPDSGNPAAPTHSYESPGPVTYRIRDADDSYFTVCQQGVDNLYQTADALAEIAASFTGSTRSA